MRERPRDGRASEARSVWYIAYANVSGKQEI